MLVKQQARSLSYIRVHVVLCRYCCLALTTMYPFPAMLTRRRCCQRASVLILVALLVFSVLLWVQQRKPAFFVRLRTRFSIVEHRTAVEKSELYVPKYPPEIPERDYETDGNGRELNEKELSEEDLNKQKKNVGIDNLNKEKNIGKFVSKEHQVEQKRHVTEENSLIEYSNKNDVNRINNSTIKQQPEQNRIDVIAKKYAITAFPAGIKVTAPSTSQLVRRFPKYMIIGFGKAGTKALFEALKLHPSLSGPETERRYFSRYYSKGLSSYLVHMPEPPPGGYTIEKSPDYITQPVVPRRILKTAKMINIDSSSLKFIVVLRNPIDRAVSEYLEWNVQHKLHHKPLLPSFSNMVLTATGKVNSSVAFLNTSCYAQHIRNWLQVFDKEQMCFVDGDRFISDPYEEVHALEQCMGLKPFFSRDNFILHSSHGFYCFVVGSKELCMGKRKGRRHPRIPQSTLSKLKMYFYPCNEQLLNLLRQNSPTREHG